MILAKVVNDDVMTVLELYHANEFGSMAELEKSMRNEPAKYNKNATYTLVEKKPTLTPSAIERTIITKGELL